MRPREGGIGRSRIRGEQPPPGMRPDIAVAVEIDIAALAGQQCGEIRGGDLAAIDRGQETRREDLPVVLERQAERRAWPTGSGPLRSGFRYSVRRCESRRR